MTGRALVFSNPDVVARLKRDFVTYAGDKWYLNRQNDGDGRFLRGLGKQAGRTADNGHAPQGVYVARPDGTLLAYDHFRPSAESFLALLDKAKTAATTAAQADNPGGPQTAVGSVADPGYARRLPDGGRVLSVFSRIPLPPPADGAWTPNQATGRDHLWLTADDLRALRPPAWRKGERYPLPPAVAERLTRFHLVDNVRGEPPFWQKADVRAQDLSLVVEDPTARRVRLEGAVRLQSGSGSEARAYDARVQGYLVWAPAADKTAPPRLTRFDWIAWGEAQGEGMYTRNAPKGRFPLVIAGGLAAPGDTVARSVPPQGTKDLRSYLGVGR